MTIIYRIEKGSPLTSLEIDGNFRELETRLNMLEGHTEAEEGFNLPPPSSLSLSLYEKATLPQSEIQGKLALFLEDDSPTLIFFNGKNWQRLMKGDIL